MVSVANGYRPEAEFRVMCVVAHSNHAATCVITERFTRVCVHVSCVVWSTVGFRLCSDTSSPYISCHGSRWRNWRPVGVPAAATSRVPTNKTNTSVSWWLWTRDNMAPSGLS